MAGGRGRGATGAGDAQAVTGGSCCDIPEDTPLVSLLEIAASPGRIVLWSREVRSGAMRMYGRQSGLGAFQGSLRGGLACGWFHYRLVWQGRVNWRRQADAIRGRRGGGGLCFALHIRSSSRTFGSRTFGSINDGGAGSGR